MGSHDKSNDILNRVYDGLNMGDYFYIKWTGTRFVFCRDDGSGSVCEDADAVYCIGCGISNTDTSELVIIVGGTNKSTFNVGYSNKYIGNYVYRMSPQPLCWLLMQEGNRIVYGPASENDMMSHVVDATMMLQDALFYKEENNNNIDDNRVLFV